MNDIWLTSDTHFNHDRSFLWQPRGFNSIQEHDEVIIENWNKIVKPNDIVFHLGDVMLGDIEYGMNCFKQLNGHINIIRGNHCTDRRWKEYNTLSNVILLGWADVIKSGKWHFYLSHYPTCVGNYEESDPKFWCLCGHSHTQDMWADVDKKCYHVELDAHNNMPVNLEQIKDDIRRHNK